MNVLKSITLKNFQSWKKQTILFEPGFNAIIGDSDSGKSSIERAVRWVKENRPLGDENFSWFANENEKSFVKLEFSDDYFITRGKIGKSNYYKINGNKLDVVGKDVPSEVTDVLDFQEYNILNQHGKYFLIENSPGERAKILNSAVGLDIIDKLFDYLNQKSRSLNVVLKGVNQNRESIKSKLENYRCLDDVERILKGLEKKSDRLKIRYSEISKGYELVEKLKKIEGEINSLKNLSEIEQKYDRISQQMALYDHNTKLKGEITRVLSSLNINKEKTIYVGDFLNELTKKYIKLLSENKICPFCENSITKETIHKIKDKMLCQ